MLIAISAIVPCIFVIVPMVITVIVAFAWANQAAHNKAYQPQQKGAFRNTLGIFHGRSNAVATTALINTSHGQPSWPFETDSSVRYRAYMTIKLGRACVAGACGIVQTIEVYNR
jgi:hypothetical protein